MNKEIFKKKYKALNNDLNFFASTKPNENANTKLLIDLLKTNEEIIYNFIKNFVCENFNKNCKLSANYNDNYRDGLIKENDNKLAVIIENKIMKAEDQYRQIERYVGQTYCDKKDFLIKIENEATEEIIKEIINKDRIEENIKEKLKELNATEKKELNLIIEHLEKDNTINDEIIILLKEKFNDYKEKILIKINTTMETKQIERENIYVLYLVPNENKIPSKSSYTIATKLFLEDRFKIKTYDEVIEWMNNLNVKPTQTCLINSINLYSHYIYKYLKKDVDTNKLINKYFSDDKNYENYKNDNYKIGEKNIDEEIEQIREKNIKDLKDYCLYCFSGNEEKYNIKIVSVGEKNEVFFRFIHNFELNDNNKYLKIRSKQPGWEQYISAFEIKYEDRSLNLYLWLAPPNKDRTKLREDIVKKLKQNCIITKKYSGGFNQIGKEIILLKEQDILRLPTSALKEKFIDKLLSLFDPSNYKIFEELKNDLELVYDESK